MKVDYLIVGSGITGTVLSFLLHKQRKTFMIIDRPVYASASRASAGICNPIVFRRLTTGWRAPQLLQEAETVYAGFEQLLDQPLIHHKEIFKLFTSKEEQVLWEKKLQDPEVMDFISIAGNELSELPVHAPFGAGKVRNAMKIDLDILMERYLGWLDKHQLIRQEEFNHTDLHFDNRQVKWKDMEAKQVVFCEGHQVVNNPWFDWLPLHPIKGEALIIRIPGLGITDLINRKLILCPLGDELFWAGATYEWKQLHTETTTSARQELQATLNALLNIPYEVIDQKAGIRPAVRDRRPLVGVHPRHPRLFVFNGMGTKGTLIAPYVASELISFIEKGKAINREIDIARFHKLFGDLEKG